MQRVQLGWEGDHLPLGLSKLQVCFRNQPWEG